jgi:hypothetical protein
VRDLDTVFANLQKSTFRSKFKLNVKDAAYYTDRGTDTITDHALDFIEKRLAPAQPPNDGKQTPMRGHPVFVAQHATATCCRSCLSKWHGIPKGRDLTQDEQAHVVAAIMRWLANRL